MKLKICGISDIDILQYACEAGVDFVGFIMANGSPRKISHDFLDSLETFNFRETSPVFVFVNPICLLLQQSHDLHVQPNQQFANLVPQMGFQHLTK